MPLVLLLVGVLVPVLAAGHIFGGVAHFRLIVVDFAELAAQVSWVFAVEADVELLAISWVRILGMHDDLTILIGLWTVFRTGEASGGFFLWRIATLTLGSIGPHAGAAVLIVMQTNGTCHLQSVAFNAVVE